MPTDTTPGKARQRGACFAFTSWMVGDIAFSPAEPVHDISSARAAATARFTK
jgi:hypothetical protein